MPSNEIYITFSYVAIQTLSFPYAIYANKDYNYGIGAQCFRANDITLIHIM